MHGRPVHSRSGCYCCRLLQAAHATSALHASQASASFSCNAGQGRSAAARPQALCTAAAAVGRPFVEQGSTPAARREPSEGQRAPPRPCAVAMSVRGTAKPTAHDPTNGAPAPSRISRVVVLNEGDPIPFELLRTRLPKLVLPNAHRSLRLSRSLTEHREAGMGAGGAAAPQTPALASKLGIHLPAS